MESGRLGAETRRGARQWLVCAVVAIGFAAGWLTLAPAAHAACPAPAGSNAVVVENCQTGSPPSEWDVTGVGDKTIQGFATDMSVNRGATVSFKVSTPATSYRIDIYRMGYYGGDGARKVATISPSATLPQTQPQCLTNASGLVDCGNWGASASWAGPASAVSGIYFAHLVRTDVPSSEGSHVFFVVRNDASQSDIYYQTSDTTWQAYNDYGGESLYSGGPLSGGSTSRAAMVSYNRPFVTRGVSSGQDWVFNAEYPMVRWLERNGYDVSYESGIDTDRLGSLIRNHKVFMATGHDEYWSGAQRANVEAARNAGVNLAFFSGNEVFWRTRWQASIDGSNTAYRTLVSYKETHENAHVDPSGEWTGTWRDGRSFNPQGPKPENALTGTIFTVNAGTRAIRVPADAGKLRLWRNTSIATLAAGAEATLSDGTLGYEWDSDLDNGSPAAGRRRPSSPPPTPRHLLDHRDRAQRPAGQRLDLRRRQRDAQPDALPRRQRRARLRRRHGAVVLGARRQPRPRQLDRRSPHAAGDGEPLRRHARPAGLARSEPDRGLGLHRHDRAVGGDRLAGRRHDRHAEHDRHHPGHRDRRGRRTGRRRRGLARRRDELASRHRARELALHVDAVSRRPGHLDGPRRRRQRQPRLGDLGRHPGRRQPQLSLQPLRRPRPGPGHRREPGDRARCALPRRRRRLRHRPALLRRRIVDAAGRPPLERGRDPARVGHLRGRLAGRLAHGGARAGRTGDQGHELRRLLPLERRHLLRRSRLLQRRVRRGAAARAGRRQRRLQVRRRLPHRPLRGHELRRRRPLHADRSDASAGRGGGTGRRRGGRRPRRPGRRRLQRGRRSRHRRLGLLLAAQRSGRARPRRRDLRRRGPYRHPAAPLAVGLGDHVHRHGQGRRRRLRRRRRQPAGPGPDVVVHHRGAAAGLQRARRGRDQGLAVGLEAQPARIDVERREAPGHLTAHRAGVEERDGQAPRHVPRGRAHPPRPAEAAGRQAHRGDQDGDGARRQDEDVRARTQPCRPPRPPAQAVAARHRRGLGQRRHRSRPHPAALTQTPLTAIRSPTSHDTDRHLEQAPADHRAGARAHRAAPRRPRGARAVQP